jgi:hypothetical protein
MSTNTSSAFHNDADEPEAGWSTQPEAGWSTQVERLQQLVSELLIKNEQLRMELFARQQRNGAVSDSGAHLNRLGLHVSMEDAGPGAIHFIWNHLCLHVICRVPPESQSDSRGVVRYRHMRDPLIEHRAYIEAIQDLKKVLDYIDQKIGDQKERVRHGVVAPTDQGVRVYEAEKTVIEGLIQQLEKRLEALPD